MAAVSVDEDPAVALIAGAGTRVQVSIYNGGPNPVYLDTTSAVTAASGYPLASGEHISVELGEAQTLYGICDTGHTAALRTITV
jgi:hypothetical protein